MVLLFDLNKCMQMTCNFLLHSTYSSILLLVRVSVGAFLQAIDF